MKLIVTHPGSSHKDDFLACCILAHLHGVTIHRREPTEDDLSTPDTCVVDTGGIHDAALKNLTLHGMTFNKPSARRQPLVGNIVVVPLITASRAAHTRVRKPLCNQCYGPLLATSLSIFVRSDVATKLMNMGREVILDAIGFILAKYGLVASHVYQFLLSAFIQI